MLACGKQNSPDNVAWPDNSAVKEYLYDVHLASGLVRHENMNQRRLITPDFGI